MICLATNIQRKIDIIMMMLICIVYCYQCMYFLQNIYKWMILVCSFSFSDQKFVTDPFIEDPSAASLKSSKKVWNRYKF